RTIVSRQWGCSGSLPGYTSRLSKRADNAPHQGGWCRELTPFCHLDTLVKLLSEGPTYDMSMQFGGTVLYVDEVSPVVDFYRRAFALELRFFDETLGFAELETGGSMLAIASHSLGEILMPHRYLRPADGRPAGIEIAFVTHDVPASFAKAIAEGATPIAAPRR